jgi:hypothetical protein
MIEQLTLDGIAPALVELDLHSPHLHRLDHIQQRVKLSPKAIDEYTALYREGHDLGHITVFDDGADRYVADGFHRITAALDAGLDTLPAVIHQGTERDALLYACSCNQHGVPLTNADKNLRVKTLLQDAECATWSDGQIARHCGVTQPFVSKVRAQLITVMSGAVAGGRPRTYTTKRGQHKTMDTAHIGQKTDAVETLFPVHGPEPNGTMARPMPEDSPRHSADAADCTPFVPDTAPQTDDSPSPPTPRADPAPEARTAHAVAHQEALTAQEHTWTLAVAGCLPPLTAALGLEPVALGCLDQATCVEMLTQHVTAAVDQLAAHARERAALQEALADSKLRVELLSQPIPAQKPPPAPRTQSPKARKPYAKRTLPPGAKKARLIAQALAYDRFSTAMVTKALGHPVAWAGATFPNLARSGEVCEGKVLIHQPGAGLPYAWAPAPTPDTERE